MQLYHTYHNQQIRRLFHSEFWEFEFSVWLHTLARSLISIFIPILLLQIGYSVEDVIIYYLLYNLIDLPFNFVVERLVRRFGAKLIMIVSNVFVLFYFAILFILTPDNWPLLIALAVAAALYDTFYWIPLRYLFMKVRSKTVESGKTTGVFYIVRNLAGLLGPAIGAVVLILANRQALILVSVFIFALSVLPLLSIKKLHERPQRPAPGFKQFFKKLRDKKNFLSSSLYSMHTSAEDVVWPVFIFLIIGTIESVALIAIIVSISTIIFTYVTGNLTKKSSSKLVLIGSGLVALTWLSRIIVQDVTFYYITVSAMGFFAIMVSLPLDADIFKRGEKVSALTTSTYENFFHMFAKFIFYLILALAVSVFETSFITAAAVMFIVMFITFAYLQHSKQKLQKT